MAYKRGRDFDRKPLNGGGRTGYRYGHTDLNKPADLPIVYKIVGDLALYLAMFCVIYFLWQFCR